MPWYIIYLIVSGVLSLFLLLMAIGNGEGSLLYRMLMIWKDIDGFWSGVKTVVVMLIMLALTPWLVVTSLFYILYCGD